MSKPASLALVSRPAKRPIGRPSERTDELATMFCAWVSTGGSMRKFCEKAGGHSTSFFCSWLNDSPEFLEQYTRAKRESARFRAEEIIEIADEEPEMIVGEGGTSRVDAGWIAWQKNRIDARKWDASKHDRAKYGEQAAQTTVNVGVQVNAHLTIDELESRLKAADA